MGFQQIVLLKKQRNILGSRIKILSPAKLNLYLNIISKYPLSHKFYNYHYIETIMERISLFDEIDIEVIKNSDILFYTNNKKIDNKSNLCIKSALLLKDRFKIDFGFKIFLNKKIPIGSGLGGGSSNAASIILAIDRLFNLKLSKEELYNIGIEIGSDVNFFISQSQFGYAYGRGERVIPFNSKPLKHLVIWPKVSLSTEKVYKSINFKLTKFLSNANIIYYAIRMADIELLKRVSFNVLEKPAISLCKEIKKIKDFFNKFGVSTYLTGSGSALYTLDGDYSFFKKKISNEWLIFEVSTI